VVSAWRQRRLAGIALRYSRTTEQMFFHYPDGRFVNTPIILRGIRRCTDGTSYDEYGPASPPAAGYDAVVHTHQDRASEENRHLPVPGTRDGVTPRRLGIPNYGLSSVGAWVIRPGTLLTLELLSGRWGARFNPVAFAAALNRGGGDATGVVCR
jgi:hypothetical protein